MIRGKRGLLTVSREGSVSFFFIGMFVLFLFFFG